MAPRKTSEIIDFREEQDATRQDILDAVDAGTIEVITVSDHIDVGNLTAAKMLLGQETEIFDTDITDADLED